MLTPEALARLLLPLTQAAIDAGRFADRMDITFSDVRALCLGLISLAEGTYPPDWLSEEAKKARAAASGSSQETRIDDDG